MCTRRAASGISTNSFCVDRVPSASFDHHLVPGLAAAPAHSVRRTRCRPPGPCSVIVAPGCGGARGGRERRAASRSPAHAPDRPTRSRQPRPPAQSPPCACPPSPPYGSIGRARAMASTPPPPGSLDLLERRRAPYAGPLAAIAGDLLARFPPAGDRPVLEIGAGAGQLRGWLPPPLRARVVHSEPSDAAARALRARDANATVVRAAAEALPFAARSCGAVLGLCVFDAVADMQATAAEIARVLRAGRPLRTPPGHGDAARASVRQAGRIRAGADPERVRGSGRSRVAAGHRPAANESGWRACCASRVTPAIPSPARSRRSSRRSSAAPFDAGAAAGAFKTIAGNGERRRTLASLLGVRQPPRGRRGPPRRRAAAVSFRPVPAEPARRQLRGGRVRRRAVRDCRARDPPARRRRREGDPLPQPVRRPRAAGVRAAPTACSPPCASRPPTATSWSRRACSPSSPGAGWP